MNKIKTVTISLPATSVTLNTHHMLILPPDEEQEVGDFTLAMEDWIRNHTRVGSDMYKAGRLLDQDVEWGFEEYYPDLDPDIRDPQYLLGYVTGLIEGLLVSGVSGMDSAQLDQNPKFKAQILSGLRALSIDQELFEHLVSSAGHHFKPLIVEALAAALPPE